MGLNQTFRVGQKVKFDAKARGIIHGVVTKINNKSIGVLILVLIRRLMELF